MQANISRALAGGGAETLVVQKTGNGSNTITVPEIAGKKNVCYAKEAKYYDGWKALTGVFIDGHVSTVTYTNTRNEMSTSGVTYDSETGTITNTGDDRIVFRGGHIYTFYAW